MRISVMPRLQDHVEHYAESHQTPVNIAIHFIGIPVLTVSTMGLFAQLTLPGYTAAAAPLQPNLGWVVLFLLLVWYLIADWKIGALTYLFICAGYVLGSYIELWPLVGMFSAGVVFHVIGHRFFEGKPPALLKKPVSVLEAPAWLLLKWAGWKRLSRQP